MIMIVNISLVLDKRIILIEVERIENTNCYRFEKLKFNPFF